jgi:hypothetical protein
LDGKNNKKMYMRMNSIPQGKDILLFCHPTWLPSRDHTKPIIGLQSFSSEDVKEKDMEVLVPQTKEATCNRRIFLVFT